MRVWIAEYGDEQDNTFQRVVRTSLPKVKDELKTRVRGEWLTYRCDVGKVDLEKVVALLSNKNYEVSRDNEQILLVDEEGNISKKRT